MLAVVHDIDAGLDLPTNHVGDRSTNLCRKHVAVIGKAGVLGVQGRQQFARARQASAMRGEDSIGAAFHDFPRSPDSRRHR
jgi:hypothetical protein